MHCNMCDITYCGRRSKANSELHATKDTGKKQYAKDQSKICRDCENCTSPHGQYCEHMSQVLHDTSRSYTTLQLTQLANQCDIYWTMSCQTYTGPKHLIARILYGLEVKKCTAESIRTHICDSQLAVYKKRNDTAFKILRNLRGAHVMVC